MEIGKPQETLLEREGENVRQKRKERDGGQVDTCISKTGSSSLLFCTSYSLKKNKMPHNTVESPFSIAGQIQATNHPNS